MSDNQFVVTGKFDDKQLNARLNNLDKTVKKAEQSATRMGTGFKKLGGVLASAFAVTAVIDFGKRVAQTRGEFQKLQAVLENTLGSKSSAQQAFRVLNQLAQKSNFGLLELTDSYVKLRNQGIEPTRQEMIALQDLANSTGKGFNQLAEALIDAQVGEMERLKEFGVRAQKEGDKVKFTFKGVTTEVQNTSEAISDYVIGLGKIQGVAGSTEKISGTLAGMISNLGDAFDNMLNQVGTDLQPQLEKTLSFVTSIFSFIPPILSELSSMSKQVLDVLDKLFIKTGVVAGIWEVLKFSINTVTSAISTLWTALQAGFTAFTLVMAGQWETAVFAIKQGIVDIGETWTTDFDKMGTIFSNIMNRMKKESKSFGKEFDKTIESNVVTVQKAERDIRSESDATALTRAKNGAEFSKIAIGQALNRAIAIMIEKIIATVPFPFNIAAAGGAGAIVKNLFSSVAKFAEGGLIGGNSFSGDKQLILANSGERILNMPQQDFLLKSSGLSNEKLDTLIEQNEQMLDMMFFGNQNKASAVTNTINFVDIYNEGVKNKALLRSN